MDSGTDLEYRRGLLYATGAYLLWGLFPLYFPLLEPAGAIEILAHRIVWSLLFVLVLLFLRRRWAWLGLLMRDRRRLLLLLAAATVIAVNWAIYIWAVNNEHVVESSLGYFINPLVTVLLGVLVLHERLSRMQWSAVGLAAVAVAVLTVDYGRLPWIALSLAASFATYGYIKKTIGMPALESLAMETAFLFLPAAAFLIVLQVNGEAAFGNEGVGNTLLLASAGVVTAIPLLLFGAGAPRVPLSTMGLLQYMTPVVQFLIGVFVFDEDMPTSRWVGFALVWIALLVMSLDGLLRARRTALASRAAAARNADPADACDSYV